MERDNEVEDVSKTCISALPRAMRAFVRLDVGGQHFLMAIFQWHNSENRLIAITYPQLDNCVISLNVSSL